MCKYSHKTHAICLASLKKGDLVMLKRNERIEENNNEKEKQEQHIDAWKNKKRRKKQADSN